MRKFASVLVATLALINAAPTPAQTRVSVDLGLDALSGYIWRGGILGADRKFVLQPSVTLGLGETGLSMNVWGSLFAQDRSSGLDEVDELDFTLDYSQSLTGSPISFSVGYIQYTFPSLESGTSHSEEVYVGLGYDHFVAPSISFYYDFGVIDDYYVTAGISPEFPLGESGAVLGLSASLGFSGDAYDFVNGSSAGFNDITVGASVGFALVSCP